MNHTWRDVIQDLTAQYHPFNDIRKYGFNAFSHMTFDFDITVPNNITIYRKLPAEVHDSCRRNL